MTPEESYELASADVRVPLSRTDAESIADMLELFAGIDEGENVDSDNLHRLAGIVRACIPPAALVRHAVVAGARDADEIAAYLPANYSVVPGIRVVFEGLESYLITGTDVAGWTLEDYVIPRLASGNIGARVLEDYELRTDPFGSLMRRADS